jgi:hypothetical protein
MEHRANVPSGGLAMTRRPFEAPIVADETSLVEGTLVSDCKEFDPRPECTIFT